MTPCRPAPLGPKPWHRSTGVGPKSGQPWPVLTQIGPTSRNLPKFGRLWPILAEIGPTSTNVGRIWADSRVPEQLTCRTLAHMPVVAGIAGGNRRMNSSRPGQKTTPRDHHQIRCGCCNRMMAHPFKRHVLKHVFKHLTCWAAKMWVMSVGRFAHERCTLLQKRCAVLYKRCSVLRGRCARAARVLYRAVRTLYSAARMLHCAVPCYTDAVLYCAAVRVLYCAVRMLYCTARMLYRTSAVLQTMEFCSTNSARRFAKQVREAAD